MHNPDINQCDYRAMTKTQQKNTLFKMSIEVIEDVKLKNEVSLNMQ